MNLHIAVCDDEEQIGFLLEEYIEKICVELSIEAETDVYYSGEGLCQKLESGECYDMIFLDIELANINGVQVGTKIRDEYHDEKRRLSTYRADSSMRWNCLTVIRLIFW